MSFVPAKHKPKLPHEANFDLSDRFYEYTRFAWKAYWQRLRRFKSRHKLVSLWEAHQKFQAKNPIPAKLDPDQDCRTGKKIGWARERICLFMSRYEDWQHKEWDDSKRGVPNLSFYADKHYGLPIEVIFERLGDYQRGDFVSILHGKDRIDLLRQLVNDPIFGPEAKFEVYWDDWSNNFHAEEAWRKSQLPDSLQEINMILSKGFPTNYNILFPWPKNQYHQIDNCCMVNGDGGTLFRLQVLDPEKCTRFLLVNLCPPWWGGRGILEMPEPGEGQYDFPFPDFGINEGDEFTIYQFLEVAKLGIEQINARSKRDE